MIMLIVIFIHVSTLYITNNYTFNDHYACLERVDMSNDKVRSGNDLALIKAQNIFVLFDNKINLSFICIYSFLHTMCLVQIELKKQHIIAMIKHFHLFDCDRH